MSDSSEALPAENAYQADQVRCIKRIRKLQDGDTAELDDAYRELIRLTTGLIQSIIKQCLRRRPHTSLTGEDLEGEAAIALMQCVAGYQEGQSQFGTYATIAIRRRLNDVLMRDSIVSGGSSLRHELWLATTQFFQLHGRDPSDEELIRDYGFTADLLADLRRSDNVKRGSVTPGDNDSSWESQFAAGGESPDAAAIRSDSVAAIVARLSDLPPKEAIAVRMRSGIDDDGTVSGNYRSFDEIAEACGCSSAAYARQLYTRGMRRLRNELVDDLPDEEPVQHAPSPLPTTANSPSPIADHQVSPAHAPPVPVVPVIVEPSPFVQAELAAATASLMDPPATEAPAPPRVIPSITTLRSVPPPERTNYGAHLAAVAAGLRDNARRKMLHALSHLPDRPVPVEALREGTRKNKERLSPETVVVYVSNIRRALAERGCDAGIIHSFVRPNVPTLERDGETSYQLTTRSWHPLAASEDLVWTSRVVMEFLAEWERRPISPQDIAKAKSGAHDVGAKLAPEIMYRLRGQRAGIVSTGRGYLYNPHTNIPEKLLAELTFHEYVLLAQCLRTGVGVAVPRQTLFERLSFAQEQLGGKPLRTNCLALATRELPPKLAARNFGIFERRTNGAKRPSILECTLKEWNSPINGPEPEPVASFEDANARRFAVLMQQYVYTLISDDDVRTYCGEVDMDALATAAQRRVPPEFRLVHLPRQGWSLTRREHEIPKNARVFEEVATPF